MFISAASTISFQPTFRNSGFSRKLQTLEEGTGILNPDYSLFIPAMDRRRMSDVLKMSVTCSKDCLEQTNVEQPDAIIVGTSMGCCTNIREFLDKILDSDGGLLSPTHFILSTHNSIAGQISLLLKNHGYNMTHTQNSLSFEQALMDAMLCIGSGSSNVLVGAADEVEKDLYNMDARLESSDLKLGCGASFFSITSQETGKKVKLCDAGSFGLIDDLNVAINNFLAANGKSINEIDTILYSASHPNTLQNLEVLFDNKKLTDYQSLCGTYYTGSAFAMHMGIDLLQNQDSNDQNTIRTVLVCNNLIPENVGLILLELNTD